MEDRTLKTARMFRLGSFVCATVFWGACGVGAAGFGSALAEVHNPSGSMDPERRARLVELLRSRAVAAQQEWMEVPRVGPVLIRWVEAQHSMLTATEAASLRQTTVGRPEHPGRQRLALYDAEMKAGGKVGPVSEGQFGHEQIVMALDRERWIHASRWSVDEVFTAAQSDRNGGWSQRGVILEWNPSVAGGVPSDPIAAARTPTTDTFANSFRYTLRSWILGGLTAHPSARFGKIELDDREQFTLVMELGPGKTGKVREYVFKGQVVGEDLFRVDSMDVLEGQSNESQNASGSPAKPLMNFTWGKRFSDHREAGALGKLVPHLTQTVQEDRKVERTTRLISVETIDEKSAKDLLVMPAGKNAKDTSGLPRKNLFGDPYVVKTYFEPAEGLVSDVDGDGKIGPARSVDEKAAGPNQLVQKTSHGSSNTWLVVLIATPPLALLVVFVIKRIRTA
jgi:hypothetical protein